MLAKEKEKKNENEKKNEKEREKEKENKIPEYGEVGLRPPQFFPQGNFFIYGFHFQTV